MIDKIDQALLRLNDNLDNPEALSRACVWFANALYHLNTQMAEAGSKEKRLIIKYIDSSLSGSKKMSVAEAEKRAVSDTNNEYQKLKLQSEAIIENINAIKHRLKILDWERTSPHVG